MNERERQTDHYDPRPAYPPPPAVKKIPVQREATEPAKIHKKEPSYMGKFYVILFFIAFGLLLISGIIGASEKYLERPDIEDYQKEIGIGWRGETPAEEKASEKAYNDDMESYEDSRRNLPATTALFLSCGLVILTFGLVIGAITDKSLPKNIKLGMLIVAGIIIAFTFASSEHITISI